ncbi:hypothetical protein BD626DRAFT_396575 [Schizophyllum amplum]|uniref:Uncharacterized protein n=1 Tax=Schizophyllum amplum TaxID=97359 RepID=A0A550CQG3_9AGAR|nr:hypothetical protein BD626DRAFT_396575 [Auriculariopsis ampla]
MRFFALTSVLAVASCALAQEAARYGAVTINGDNTVSAGQTFSVTYNSTVARYTPNTVDFLLQGTLPNGKRSAYVVLARNDFSADQEVLQQDLTMPDVTTALGSDITNWLLISEITYNYDDYTPPVVMSGGTTAPINIV